MCNFFQEFKVSLVKDSLAIVILRYKTPIEIMTEKNFKVKLKTINGLNV